MDSVQITVRENAAYQPTEKTDILARTVVVAQIEVELHNSMRLAIDIDTERER